MMKDFIFICIPQLTKISKFQKKKRIQIDCHLRTHYGLYSLEWECGALILKSQPLQVGKGFPGSSVVKNLPTPGGTGSTLGLGRAPEEG